MAEQVLVVPRSRIFPGPAFLGFLPAGLSEEATVELSMDLDALSDSARYLPRDEAENDPQWKQIIPYAALVRGPTPAGLPTDVFLLRRRSGGGEARLHARRSIGVGGHINPVDGEPRELGLRAVIERALRRELHEEIAHLTTLETECVGFINDDRNDVGRVHFGVAYRCWIHPGGKTPSVRETDSLEGEFAGLGRVESCREELESWSVFLYEGLTRPGAPLPRR